MKIQPYLTAISLSALLLTGCSPEETLSEIPKSLESEAQQEVSEETVLPETQEATVRTIDPPEIYYLTSHGTQDTADLTKFIAELENIGYIWHEAEISAIPSDTDILILNTPQEDITKDEFQILEGYMNSGGNFLYLLPASESEVRYKYLNMLSEEFCIQIDYDIITETDKSHIQPDDSIQIQAINFPERFGFYDDSMEDGIVYMRNLRSFHMMSEQSNLSIFMDEMLETSATAVGEPFGGVEDDPLTYENETLSVMLYCRDELRKNASLIAVGSSDFLLDENYEAETSESAQNWIFSSLGWFTAYERY